MITEKGYKNKIPLNLCKFACDIANDCDLTIRGYPCTLRLKKFGKWKNKMDDSGVKTTNGLIYLFF